MKRTINDKFGRVIKSLREEKGLSQEKLAELSTLHRTYIGFIERNERNITLVTAEKLSKALDIELVDIFELVKKDK